MTHSTNKTIDEKVLAAYNNGIEKNRLRSGIGWIEFERTKELLLEHLPKLPCVIYDIGGGYGEYAWFLASQGYEAHLYDIAETNIRMAQDLAAEFPNIQLASLRVADARSIPMPDASADAILFMGPMYHIVEHEERILALKECHRLLKPGGKLFTAAITRYATTLWATTVFGVNNELLSEPAFMHMVETEIKTGHHIPPENSKYRGMGRSYFHLPEELKAEISAAGFTHTDVRGVVGCGWLAPNLDEALKDSVRRESIMAVVRLVEKEDSLMGLSTHLLAISEKP